MGFPVRPPFWPFPLFPHVEIILQPCLIDQQEHPDEMHGDADFLLQEMWSWETGTDREIEAHNRIYDQRFGDQHGRKRKCVHTQN